jgi:BioD-like phosphotransacetylase family protein
MNYLQNTTTPRIFVAATRQDEGKTTTCVGLFRALEKRFADIGYIKPVGQRFVEVEGLKVDEDSMLMNETYRVRSPLRAMSPIAVEPKFTRHYLQHGHAAELQNKVQTAFDEVAWEKDFVIIEGTGHAGVGSIFDLSNAVVARLLHSKVILVSQGGIGRPIDEIAMNLALFEKHGVEVCGAIINKIEPDKLDLIPYLRKALKRMGLPLLGAMPMQQELRKPTLNQVCQQLHGEFLSGADLKRRRVGKVILGTMSSYQASRYFPTQGLLIASGDRDDLILSATQCYAAEKRHQLSGVVLTDSTLPDPGVTQFIRQSGLPFIVCACDGYTAASIINKMTVKTESADREKIHLIQQMVDEYLDVNLIVELGKMEIPQPQLDFGPEP